MSIFEDLSTTKTILLDFLFPKQCINCAKFGSYLCNYCKKNFVEFETENICHVCKHEIFDLRPTTTHTGCREDTSLNNVNSAVKYTKLAENLVKAVKYKLNYDLVEVISQLMFEVIDLSKLQDSVLVPVPLHRRKQWKRGFNQAELISNQLERHCNKLNIDTTVVNLLKRTRNTKTQVGMLKEERQINLNGVFELCKIKKIEDYRNKKIILVDDVVTTGTTLEKCASVLIENGFENVSALIFARA